MKLSRPESCFVVLIIFRTLPRTISSQSFLLSCYCDGHPFHMNQAEFPSLQALRSATVQPCAWKYRWVRGPSEAVGRRLRHAALEPFIAWHHSCWRPAQTPYTVAGAIFSTSKPCHYPKAPIFYLGFSTYRLTNYCPEEQRWVSQRRALQHQKRQRTWKAHINPHHIQGTSI